jgi:hypothetical protein
MYKLAHKKARYPALVAVGLLTLAQIVSHDAAIYSAIESGETDISSVRDLFMPQLSHEFDVWIIRILLGAMTAMIILAIMIRIAQHQYARNR